MIFGNENNKGYLLRENKYGKYDKCFIKDIKEDDLVSSFGHDDKNQVFIVYDYYNHEVYEPYTLGTNKNVDIAIKTFVNEKRKKNQKVSILKEKKSWFFDFLKKR